MAIRRQGVYWLITIKYADYNLPTELPRNVAWIKGQVEIGQLEDSIAGGQRGSLPTSGYKHWQIFACFTRKVSLSGAKEVFGSTAHCELSKSKNAESYVWKDKTAVDGTRFELGERPFKRNDAKDWEHIWELATKGDITLIPADVRVLHYRTLKAIGGDYESPAPMERTCRLYWGATSTGKSYRAWEEATDQAYAKDPRSKFWCGYKGETNIVIDEFRGGIDISHMLRWLDRYPVRVEVKGSSRPLKANKFWITSNIPPEQWYPELDSETVSALLRRLVVFNLTEKYNS